MLRRLALFCWLLLAPLHAQTAPLLKSADLQADVDLLRRAYEAMHPGLYRYNTRAQMDAHFHELNTRLDHDQTLAEAFLAFSRFTAEVRCGHTQLNPFNQSKAVIDALFKSPTRVPFYFLWLNRRMIVLRDFTPNHALPPGTEVLSVNGTPAAQILSTLLPFARADGANDNKRIAQLAVTGDSRYETFDLYFPLLLPQTTPTLRLMVRPPQSRHPQALTVAPLTFEQRIAPLQQQAGPDANTAPLFTWQTLPDGTAFLRMPTWALYNSKWSWKPWLQDHMEALVKTGAPALVVDLRGNEGGEDIGNEILPYLIDRPLALTPMRRFVRYRTAPQDLVPILDTWDKSFLSWGAAAQDLTTPWPTAPGDVSYLQLVRDNDDAVGDLIQPAPHRFTGRVFVLIDASNSSATFQFAQAVQTAHLATLLGQTTGGSQRGINGGAFFFLRLPHSGLEADLPVIATFPPTPAPDAGITPDILIEPSLNDIAAGSDPALAAIHALLTRQAPQPATGALQPPPAPGRLTP